MRQDILIARCRDQRELIGRDVEHCREILHLAQMQGVETIQHKRTQASKSQMLNTFESS